VKSATATRQLLLLAGEDGIGKSRLLAEIGRMRDGMAFPLAKGESRAPGTHDVSPHCS